MGTPQIINKGLGEILSPCFLRAESAPHPIPRLRSLIVLGFYLRQLLTNSESGGVAVATLNSIVECQIGS
jgi:hypothetical protein